MIKESSFNWQADNKTKSDGKYRKVLSKTAKEECSISFNLNGWKNSQSGRENNKWDLTWKLVKKKESEPLKTVLKEFNYSAA